MVTQDYYATLGLSPASEDVVIRAAYLALVRRYHPDGNPSAAAAARTRAVNAAYAVLGDPERRAEYDQARAADSWAEAPPRRRGTPTGLFAAAAVALLVLLLPLAIWLPPSIPEPLAGQPGAAAAADPNLAAAVPVQTSRMTDGPFATPDAAEDRPTSAPREIDRPRPKPKPAPLPQPTIRAAAAPAVPKVKAAKAVAPLATEATPSFSCSIARTSGEIAVCGSARLATLDRHQALLYNQSWGLADEAKRAQLLSSRERFIARRDSCRSDACARGAYLDLMREVSDIMTGASQQLR
ncbi:MAG TPA: DnaJ domain-containing protein [Sphingomicrobium sp.]|nr:DnaJ domain-containing protein [Sphingomicrobium sp.]